METAPWNTDNRLPDIVNPTVIAWTNSTTGLIEYSIRNIGQGSLVHFVGNPQRDVVKIDGNEAKVLFVHFRSLLGHPADLLGHPADLLGHPADLLGHPADLLGHPADLLTGYTYMCPITIESTETTGGYVLKKHGHNNCAPKCVFSVQGYQMLIRQPSVKCPYCRISIDQTTFQSVDKKVLTN